MKLTSPNRLSTKHWFVKHEPYSIKSVPYENTVVNHFDLSKNVILYK